MASRRSAPPTRWLADAGLGALIILAPLAGGSWKLEVLPVLLGLAIVAWVSVCMAGRRRRLHLGALSAALLLLAGYTALQALPLPAGLLAALSPRAAELRAFMAGQPGPGPLSYEAGATWREAAKLVLYALVVQVARERVRVHGGRERVAIPLVLAGLAAAGIAVLHRALGIDRLFGLIDTLTSPREMLSTFVNPNHAAGFMVLTALTAVGLAVDAQDNTRRLAFIGAAAVAAGVSVLSLSKGGFGALLLGLALFAALWLLRRRRGGDRDPGSAPAVAAAACLVPVAAILWRLEDLVALLEPRPGEQGLGLAEKAAALQDAFPMMQDHLLAGVGRGAYVSVYTLYKTSPLQLTFAFPENLAAQLLSEWGVVVGGLALLGLTTAVLGRLWRARRPVPLAMMCGVAAILAQNLVDFSLELPGMAIPVAAILGAASADWSGTRKLSRAEPSFWTVMAVGPALGTAAVVMAFVAGDLPRDMQEVQARLEAALARAPVSEAPPLADLVARHPASAMMAAQAAYLLEMKTPPDLPGAIVQANRTLYLAPTYAGGHLVAGRLLIRSGHRRQGFGELRRAWALSGADTLPTYVEHVIDLARQPAEVVHAVPRRDPEADVVSERELARVARRLAARGRTEWAQPLLREHVDLQQVPQEDLRVVAVAADAVGDPDLALAAAGRLLEADPRDQSTRLLAAQVSFRHGRPQEARRLLAGLEADRQSQEELLELRLRLEVLDRDLAAAEATLKALKARATPGAVREAQLALLESELYHRTGDAPQALEVLDHALSARPGDVELRVARAALLLEQGRAEAARSDLQHVLRRRPQHAQALRLMDRLSPEASP
jgi:tetratricopeptide (TPR) repeat protein